MKKPPFHLRPVALSMVVFLACAALSVVAEVADTSATWRGNWPQFRGPNGSAVSAETGLPVEWAKDKNIRWKAPLPGKGLSNPVIAGGRIFVTASSGFQESRLHVLCLDQASGKQLWHRQFLATGNTLCHEKSNMAAPTPVTDGKAVYALFATGDLVALDAEGNLLWYRSLARDYPPLANNVGMAASPVLWKDLLILPLDNAGESFVAAIDVKTGQNRWKTARPRDINWVSPLLVPRGDKVEVVIGAVGGLTAYDVQTGKKLWSYAGSGFSNTSTPVLGDGQGEVLILAAAGQFAAIRPGAEKAEPKLAWQSNKLHPNITSPLYYQKRVYVLNPSNILVCADAANGKVIWQQRLAEGTYWSSPVAADGKIYTVNDAGTTTVVQAGDKPKILAKNILDDPILATPAVADGCLFLRSDRYVYCVSGTRELPK
jgi:outer membrane protein assembly factor BamB